MATQPRLRLAEVEQRLCDVASEQLGIPRSRISPSDRLLEVLHCDSLNLVELFMEAEDEFGITLPNDNENPTFKAVFTRQPFRLSDLAELVYLQQGTEKPERRIWRKRRAEPPAVAFRPFTQLEGRWGGKLTAERPLFEPLTSGAANPQYRRRSDGMRSVLIPSATVELGSDLPDADSDERPPHKAQIDAFLIDVEPVSTTAYCRFLNSIGDVDAETLRDWLVLEADDDRSEHMLVHREESEWRPHQGCEKWPIILVSWFGANAYSLWANGRDWTRYVGEPDSESFLPSEAQWEYAARGPSFRSFPWGEESPTQESMRYGQHRKGTKYQVNDLPLADVNEKLGMSPFGLHHMAGNVWQWCRDWYREDFYQQSESSSRNPVSRVPTQIRSERGGSWIGPAELCRSSFRRGRPPNARGRCLGFRCVGLASVSVRGVNEFIKDWVERIDPIV